MAKLYFEYGAMGAQKSTKLLAVAHNYEERGNKTLLTKPSIDTKGDRVIVSRIGLEREVDFLASPDTDIEREVMTRHEESIRESNKGIIVLLVDEAQFLEPEQVNQLFNLAVIRSIPVLAYGLRTDFQTRSFPGSRRLMEIAHEIRESVTMCAIGDGCEKKAVFNARAVEGAYVTEGDQVAIDGADDLEYKPLCGGHFIEHVGSLPAE